MNVLVWLDPWEFSPVFLAVFVAAALLYLLGSRRHRPGASRQLRFWLGMALIYIGLNTRLDYYAEHEFFVHRLQHVLLHHLGPFLIAFSYPGATLRGGFPLRWRRRWIAPFLRSRPVQWLARIIFNPWVAGFLFDALIYLWLYPPLHFVAMLDAHLYLVMNWSVTVDGLLFWWLVLDRRPKPPARLGAGMRVLVPLFVAVPQLLLGSYIAFATSDLYPIYKLCGKAFASISAIQSQQLGGIILWIPGGMMSALASIIAFRHWLSLSTRQRLPRQETRRRRKRGLELDR